MSVSYKTLKKGVWKVEGLLTMSQKEVDRLKVLQDIEEKKLTVGKGSELLGITENLQDIKKAKM